MDRPGRPLTTTEVHFWRRYSAGWHVLFAAAVILVGVLLVTDGQAPPGSRWFGGATLVALSAWYAAFGVRAVRCEDQRAGLVYLIGAVVCFALLMRLSTVSGFLLFTAYPHVFVMHHNWRVRMGFLAIFATEVSLGLVYRRGASWETLASVGLTVAFPFVAAVALGAFITGIIVQSRRRADLIDELTRTRIALAQERHEAGVYAERARLAADIHDTLAQAFASLVLLAQAAQAAMARDTGALGSRLELIERTARDGLDEARALVAALSPPDLAEHGLGDALTRLAGRFTRNTGLPARVDVAGAGPGAPDTDVVLLRAAQEALANVAKHASASAVQIVLSRVDDRIVLTVTDDGCGFEPDTVQEGYGLPGLRNRLAASGGTFAVRSAPGDGTTLSVEMPT